LRAETLKAAFSRPEIDEFNPMSDAQAHRRWHMPLDEYIDVHLIRRGVVPTLLQLPRVTARSAYQTHVRPRIPEAAKEVYRRVRRRGARPSVPVGNGRTIRQDKE
jgi:hypothetical protein